MNLPETPALERLHELLHAQCERGLDSAEITELQLLVTNDTDLRRHYLQYVLVHARLQEDHAARDPSIPREQTGSGDARALGSLHSSGPEHRGVAAGPTRRRQFNYPLVVSRIAVAASFYGVFTLLTWSLLTGLHRPAQLVGESITNSSASSAVATLIASSGAKWKARHVMSSHARMFTDRYELDFGVAEIRFDSGATVSLQAPAVLDLRSTGDCYLYRGTLAAVVPEPARGFAVQTPTARIVDLGTEFGVKVNGLESTHVEVFSGEVLISSMQSQQSASPPTRLVAGDARSVDAVGQIAMVAPRPEGFRSIGGQRRFARSAMKTDPSSSGSGTRLDESVWMVRTDLPVQQAAVSTESGLIRLANRGYLISRREYRPAPESPLRVTGKFYFVGPSDSFQLATRADGTPGTEYGELIDGLEFGYWPSAPEFTGILVRGNRLHVEDVKCDGHLDAIPGMVLAFEVVDRGNDVRFAIWQASLPANRLVYTARVTQDSTEKHHVVLHNRERGEFDNVLYVDGFKIEQTTEATKPH